MDCSGESDESVPSEADIDEDIDSEDRSLDSFGTSMTKYSEEDMVGLDIYVNRDVRHRLEPSNVFSKADYQAEVGELPQSDTRPEFDSLGLLLHHCGMLKERYWFREYLDHVEDLLKTCQYVSVLGPTGSGVSSFGVFLLHAFLLSGKTVVFVSVYVDRYVDFCQVFRPGSETASERLKAMPSIADAIYLSDGFWDTPPGNMQMVIIGKCYGSLPNCPLHARLYIPGWQFEEMAPFVRRFFPEDRELNIWNRFRLSGGWNIYLACNFFENKGTVVSRALALFPGKGCSPLVVHVPRYVDGKPIAFELDFASRRIDRNSARLSPNWTHTVGFFVGQTHLRRLLLWHFEQLAIRFLESTGVSTPLIMPKNAYRVFDGGTVNGFFANAKDLFLFKTSFDGLEDIDSAQIAKVSRHLVRHKLIPTEKQLTPQLVYVLPSVPAQSFDRSWIYVPGFETYL